MQVMNYASTGSSDAFDRDCTKRIESAKEPETVQRDNLLFGAASSAMNFQKVTHQKGDSPLRKREDSFSEGKHTNGESESSLSVSAFIGVDDVLNENGQGQEASMTCQSGKTSTSSVPEIRFHLRDVAANDKSLKHRMMPSERHLQTGATMEETSTQFCFGDDGSSTPLSRSRRRLRTLLSSSDSSIDSSSEMGVSQESTLDVSNSQSLCSESSSKR